MSEAVTEAGESGDEATGWTQENLQKLLASLKDALPANDKTKSYVRGLKRVDWDKVAFPPFSARECREKWRSLRQAMCKYRSLYDILDEAQDLLSNPFYDKNIHPDLPKPPDPPKNAYIRRCVSRWRRKNPGIRVAMKNIFSKEYENLSDKKKAKYAKKYRLAFEEYSRNMGKFCKENNLRAPMKKKKKKGVALEYEGEGNDNDLPQKPPWHGYGLFIREHSQAGTGEDSSLGGSFIRVMSQRWKELSKNEKQKYKKRCAEMKREYEVNLMNYLDRLDEKEKKQLIKEKLIQMPKKTLDRYKLQPGEPKMPSQSGFIYFYLDMLKHAEKSMPRQALEEKAKKEWQELPETEKNQYAEIIEKNMRKYAEELEAWFQTLTQKEQRNYMMKKPDNVAFLQKHVDIKKEPPNPSSDVKKRTAQMVTRASRRMKTSKDEGCLL